MNQEFEGINFDRENYLPNSKEQVKYLRKIIGKRPTAILLHGPSLIELDKKIDLLKEFDVAYCSMNSFWLSENILAKINKNLSILITTSRSCFERRIDDIEEYLSRDEENIFITTKFSMSWMDNDIETNFLNKHNKKLLLIDSIPFKGYSPYSRLAPHHNQTDFKLNWGDGTAPNIEYPLHTLYGFATIGTLLQMVIFSLSPFILLFGMDGGEVDKEPQYYSSKIIKLIDNDRGKSLAKDTIFFNEQYHLILNNLKNNFSLDPVILNVSKKSKYTVFEKAGYFEGFKRLRDFIGKSR